MFKIMEAVITLKSCELRVVGYQKKKKKNKYTILEYPYPGFRLEF